MGERPRVDHPVDRPELYEPKRSQVTGTNGRSLDRFYRYSLSKHEQSMSAAQINIKITNQKVVRQTRSRDNLKT